MTKPTRTFVAGFLLLLAPLVAVPYPGEPKPDHPTVTIERIYLDPHGDYVLEQHDVPHHDIETAIDAMSAQADTIHVELNAYGAHATLVERIAVHPNDVHYCFLEAVDDSTNDLEWLGVDA